MGNLLLGIWLILFGLNLASVIAISAVFLGISAIVVGIVILIEGRGVITTRL